MTQGVSPYALLKASKPKETATFQTPYDLYSQTQYAPAYQPSVPAEPPPSPPMPAAPPTRRTHYIADINTRHCAAMRRTPLRDQPL